MDCIFRHAFDSHFLAQSVINNDFHHSVLRRRRWLYLKLMRLFRPVQQLLLTLSFPLSLLFSSFQVHFLLITFLSPLLPLLGTFSWLYLFLALFISRITPVSATVLVPIIRPGPGSVAPVFFMMLFPVFGSRAIPRVTAFWLFALRRSFH